MPPDPQHPMEPPSHNAHAKVSPLSMGLAVAVRRVVRPASPRSIGLGRPLVHPAPGGAVGLLLAGLDFAARDAPPAPDFPVRPEPAGMESPGVDDFEWAVWRRRLAQKLVVKSSITAPADDGLVDTDSAGMVATRAKGGVSPAAGVSASETTVARPQHSALFSTLTPQENRNPALTDMNRPSGGADIASIMALSSGDKISSISVPPQHSTVPSKRRAQYIDTAL